MKRFLMKENKLAKVTTCTASTSSTNDTAAFLDAKGYDTICALVRLFETTGDPTVTIKLMADTASTGTGTAVDTISWTAGTTGDIGAIQCQTNVKGASYRYYYVNVTAASGVAKARTMYFLGAPRHGPVTQPSATVRSTTVAA